MDWLINLFFNDVSGVAHTVLIFALAIAIGIPLGRIKIFGISLGITLVLFVGIALGQLGFRVNEGVLHFVKELGLILFVFSIGLQVGPGFFASLKKGGMLLNALAVTAVLASVLMAIVFHFITKIPMYTMAGVMSGAITNTPGLGAAQQALSDTVNGIFAANAATPERIPALIEQFSGTTLADYSSAGKVIEQLSGTMGQGYACAYPLAVVGIIISLILIRVIFKISLSKEAEANQNGDSALGDSSTAITLEVQNPALVGKTMSKISELFGSREFVVSRIRRGENPPTLPTAETVLEAGDRVLVIASKANAEAITTFFGKKLDWVRDDWDNLKSTIVRRRIIVSQDKINGRTLSRLDAYTAMGVAITRINRAGVVLIATPNLRLQIGDRVNVVGEEHAVNAIEKALGNELKRLDHPHLLAVFLGIALGVILGSIPFAIPGLSQPLKLGLAGGPLIVAILLSSLGYKSHLITYTPLAANLMIREIGILFFLASVGLGAGNGFLEAVCGGGYWWVLIGFFITTIPLLLVGIIARSVFKMNYYTIMGLVAGITTDPPALAYANNVAQNEAPNVAYATVYPLTMFMRVLVAQLIILVFCA